MVVIIHNALCCSLLGLLVFFVLKLFLIQSNSDGVLRVFLGLWYLNWRQFNSLLIGRWLIVLIAHLLNILHLTVLGSDL